MLEVSRWRRLALAIGRIYRPRSLAIGLIAAQPLWANATEVQDGSAPTDAEYNPYLYLDWLPKWQLTPAQRATMPAVCSGAFVEPQRNYPDAHLTPDEAPLRATADESIWLEDGTAQLRGNVHVTQGYRQLFADQVDVNRSENTAQLRGSIEMREPNLLVRGSAAEVHTDSKAAAIEDATYVVHDAFVHGHANQAAREASGELTLTQGNYTRCEPGKEIWRVSGGEITIDSVERQGVARDVRLEIADVPIFYFPYLRFPVGDARLSGLLFPSISSNSENGWDIAIPYYWNIAPQMDATIVPRYIQYRGTGAEVEVRHLSRMFNTEIRLAGLPDDKGGDDEDARDLIEAGFPEDLVLPAKGTDRWLLNIEQQGGVGSFWRTEIDYTKVSDPDYFRDLDTANLSVSAETKVNQTIQASVSNDHWRATLRTQDYQLLQKDQFDTYAQLPRLDVDGNYRWGNWQLSLENEVTSWDHDETQTIRYIADTDDPDSVTESTRDFVTGERVRLDYELYWDKQWLWGYIKPGVAARYLGYNLDDQFLKTGTSDTPEASAAQFTLDTGLFFERDGYAFGHDYVQTLEPRLFALVSSDADQDDFIDISEDALDGGNDLLFDTSLFTFSYDQLFRDSRFTGNDRIDDADRVALGLTTRFIDPRSGRDLLSASIGQIYYSDDARIGTSDFIEASPRSELAARLESRPIQPLRIASEIVYDDSEHNINRGNFSLRYLDDKLRIFNLGYVYQRDNDEIILTNGKVTDESIRQGNVSAVLPVNAHTSILAGANYDFTYDRELEYLAGVEYDSCCYRARLVWRRSLDNDLADVVDPEDLEFDEGVYLELQLKGLAGLGSTVSNMLSQGIANFDQREVLKQ
ncbi:LPS-assembly protein LptD [Microbulbifer thermotolerans]|uniref:LPS-assembly protein LptD n=1 Tax=Microbulbifer thermotolerans TaxID=252514 RepID=UPI00224A84DD|nr:LPS-assembly protein LptD [Microbulbifer thermotolerans]MCX2842746.1 LPS-assembly protein LptD [Microbulbifer thermotolerans]